MGGDGTGDELDGEAEQGTQQEDVPPGKVHLERAVPGYGETAGHSQQPRSVAVPTFSGGANINC